MFWLKHSFVWLRRIGHCRGFGIQSPTDYWLVRNVINEHWPYYAYEQLGIGERPLRRKLGQLYFRLANWRQPQVIVSSDYADYFRAACKGVTVTGQADGKVELMRLVPEETVGPEDIYNKVDERSVVIVEDIAHHRKLWKRMVADQRTGITFDLYYCGIVMFDKKRTKQNYIINF